MKNQDMIKKNDYDYIIGMSKKEVLLELGDGFNYFPDNLWTYTLKNSWLGKKVILILIFNDNQVKETEVKKLWR